MEKKRPNKVIQQISDLLLELSSGQFNSSQSESKPVDMDVLLSGINEQDYTYYNELLDRLENATINIGNLKSVFRSIVDMLIVLKPDFTIYQVNDKVCEILGFEKKVLIGKPLAALLTEESQLVLKNYRPFLNKNGFFNNLEQDIITTEGKIIPITSSCSYLYDQNKEITGVLYVLKDISNLKKTEKLLKLRNEELNTFVYKASHDLKSPLASTGGLLNLATLAADNPIEIRYYLGLMNKSIKRMDYILNELLEFTKISQGTINHTDIEFNNLVDDIILSMSHIDDFELIEFDIEVNQYTKFVNDESIMRSILLNLIQNSVKYKRQDLDKPKVKITITIDEDEAVLIVEDNGQGMSEEVVANIFKMFYRGNEFSDGTGLGLYIVKTGVEKIHGEIEVDSTLDVGSVFTIRLPNENTDTGNIKKMKTA
ncbi:MAG: PAS domain-containing sensor histidine kinase [Bacteroidetes bacterium]|nr:PAS domain-containing sensor histidine kinase [Bacteroidota bacterium]